MISIPNVRLEKLVRNISLFKQLYTENTGEKQENENRKILKIIKAISVTKEN